MRRAEAAAADRALATGAPVGPVHGVPFTAKDPIAVAGGATGNPHAPADGETPLWSRIAVIGPLARGADDLSLARHLDAWTQLGVLEREVGAWFERRRLALCPVAPGPAPPIGEGFTEVDGEPVRPGGKLGLCTLANAIGLPAAAVPVLRTDGGLPIGVQLIGGRGRDLEVIEAARMLERPSGDSSHPERGLTRGRAPRRARRCR